MIGELRLDWYTFNVATLCVDIAVTFFSMSALLIVLEEKRALKREKEEWLRRENAARYGIKK